MDEKLAILLPQYETMVGDYQELTRQIASDFRYALLFPAALAAWILEREEKFSSFVLSCPFL